jgi:hypothetical protein
VRLETTRVELGALFYKSQRYSLAWEIETYVNTSSDEIKLLPRAPSTSLDLNGDQVLTEVTSSGVDEETLATCILDRH